MPESTTKLPDETGPAAPTPADRSDERLVQSTGLKGAIDNFVVATGDSGISSTLSRRARRSLTRPATSLSGSTPEARSRSRSCSNPSQWS